MLALRRAVPSLRPSLARFMAAEAAAPAATSQAAAPIDPEHRAWLDSVKKNPVTIPKFEWTLEWALPTPVPMHQFEQSPIVIEVKDRCPNPDALVYKGPNVVGGYIHPESGKVVSMEEHEKVAKQFESHSAHDAHHH